MSQNELAKVEQLAQAYSALKTNISKKIIGQPEVVELVIISILCGGHSLLVGVPGLAKTKLIQTISEVLDLDFKRVQFTPDLMPSDITGTEILREQEFKFIKGPIFTNILLADEINRTPPKTQAALLEAMQEKQVTNAGLDYTLPKPFFVLATQNPIEQEGTYPLPEAQLDRFLFQILVSYPSMQEEIEIVKNTTSLEEEKLEKIMDAQDIVEFQKIVRKVPVADNVIEYAVKLVHKTRPSHSESNNFISWGAGPRASQNLVLAGKCHAILHGKLSPDIEDIKAIAIPVLRHRIVRNYKAEAEGITTDKIIQSIL